MTQPTAYSRQYNFTDYQSSNPSSPLPGVQVDAEYNAIKLTLSQTLANLALIQRDDGKLANQSVGKDTLDASALALLSLSGFTPKGAWTTATTYAIGDLVDFNYATYVATAAHTSATAFATDLSANRWLLLANAALQNSSASINTFIGNGTTKTFTLSYSYTAANQAQVYVNGILKTPTTDYTISGTTLTFVDAPPAPGTAGVANIVVWGIDLATVAAKDAALAAQDNAQGYATDANASKVAAAASATSAASSAAESTSSAGLAGQWASLTTGQVATTDYSAKAWAVGGTGVTNTASRGAAKEWAVKTSGTVDGTDYSAKYYSQQASTSATAAAASQSAAATSATNAASSASSASTSATNAAASATTATTKATDAATSATAASTSATNSASSASAAATSATNAASSATAASSSSSAASTSATNAASSASAAATSATNAASSATSSATSATLSQDWAIKTTGYVQGTEYSAKYWAQQAASIVTAGVIDDTTTNTLKAWSSSKTSSELATKLNLSGGTMTGVVTFAAAQTFAAAAVTGLATVATSGAYTDLSGRPTLATVATTGAYTDLTGRPTLPTGAIVGTTDTQTLSAKTLQSPNITSGLTLTGAAGTAGQVLTSAGSGAAPVWASVAGTPDFVLLSQGVI